MWKLKKETEIVDAILLSVFSPWLGISTAGTTHHPPPALYRSPAAPALRPLTIINKKTSEHDQNGRPCQIANTWLSSLDPPVVLVIQFLTQLQ